MAELWRPGRCNETAGFLFQHECGNAPIAQCDACRKPLCAEHLHDAAGQRLCTTCVKQQQRQQAGRSTHIDNDDPYFYGDRYYDGYGRYTTGYWGHHYIQGRRHEPHDFTEADAESLQETGFDDEDFETNMSES